MGDQPAGKDFTLAPQIEIVNDPEFYNINALTEADAKDTLDQSVLARVVRFHSALAREGLSAGYAYHHAGLILENLHAIYERKKLKKAGRLPVLAAESQIAADRLYVNTVKNLCAGLVDHLHKSKTFASTEEKRVAEIWQRN